jgi:hypothetical protein
MAMTGKKLFVLCMLYWQDGWWWFEGSQREVTAIRIALAGVTDIKLLLFFVFRLTFFILLVNIIKVLKGNNKFHWVISARLKILM